MSIATFTLGTSARTRRVASMPDDAGHAHVHQHEVGDELDDAVDRVEPVTGLADDLDVGLVLEHEPHAAPEQRVRIGEQDAYRSSAASVTDDVGTVDRVSPSPRSGRARRRAGGRPPTRAGVGVA